MNVLKPHLQTTIRTLLAGGTSQREIERVTGVSRHTIRAYQKRLASEGEANCPGVATDPAEQTAPPRPPALQTTAVPASAISLCEPHRASIEEQLRLGRNAMAIYQDLVDRHGFTGRYNSVKRCMLRMRNAEPICRQKEVDAFQKARSICRKGRTPVHHATVVPE